MQSTGHSAHIGEEVEVFYRWHPLHRRRVRLQYGEQRLAGRFVHVEASPGVVVALAAWMLDPVACAGMMMGAPRVGVSALIDLHQLLIERGFRGSSLVDSRFVKEEQNEQFAKVGSTNADAAPVPTPTQHPVQLHPPSGIEPVGAGESDRMLGHPLDASGGRRDGGAQR